VRRKNLYLIERKAIEIVILFGQFFILSFTSHLVLDPIKCFFLSWFQTENFLHFKFHQCVSHVPSVPLSFSSPSLNTHWPVQIMQFLTVKFCSSSSYSFFFFRLNIFIWPCSSTIFPCTRGDADMSLARPTSRCCRTESMVSLERRVCSCAELEVFSCYRGRKKACQATRAISTTSRRELSQRFFFSCKVRRRTKFTPIWKKH